MILGFIGTGKISSSIIYGIYNYKLKVKRIYISSRNKNIAKKLQRQFRQVKIIRDNQKIIDKSSTVILGLTPSVGNRILPKLNFSRNKKIISLISTINIAKLKKLTKKTPEAFLRFGSFKGSYGCAPCNALKKMYFIRALRLQRSCLFHFLVLRTKLCLLR